MRNYVKNGRGRVSESDQELEKGVSGEGWVFTGKKMRGLAQEFKGGRGYSAPMNWLTKLGDRFSTTKLETASAALDHEPA